MTDYPRLAEMGITHPQQIVSFAVNSLGLTDYLRIVYDRPEGSLSASSRSYKFPRSQVKIESGDRSASPGYVMQSNKAFREAVAELQAILDSRENKQDLATSMLHQLLQLEEEFALHTESLKTLIKKVGAL